MDGRSSGSTTTLGISAAPPHGVDRRRHPRHARAGRRAAAGHARGLAARTRRRAARRARPVNRRYPIADVLDARARHARDAAAGGSPSSTRASTASTTIPHQAARARRPAARLPRRRAREPHPAQRHRRLRGWAVAAASGSTSSHGCPASRGGHRHRAPQPGHRDRRRLRPAANWAARAERSGSHAARLREGASRLARGACDRRGADEGASGWHGAEWTR